MVIDELTVLPPEAEIVAEVVFETTEVFTVKVAWLWPAGTVTLGATVAEPLDDVSPTTIPPAAAGSTRNTWPVTGFPPTTELGCKISCDIAPPLFPDEAGEIDKIPDTVLGPTAVICTTAGAVWPINTGNDALLAPAGMLRVDGTVTSGELLVKEMVCPCGPVAPTS